MLNKGISLGLVEKDKFPKDKRFFIQIRRTYLKRRTKQNLFLKEGTNNESSISDTP